MRDGQLDGSSLVRPRSCRDLAECVHDVRTSFRMRGTCEGALMHGEWPRRGARAGARHRPMSAFRARRRIERELLRTERNQTGGVNIKQARTHARSLGLRLALEGRRPARGRALRYCSRGKALRAAQRRVGRAPGFVRAVALIAGRAEPFTARRVGGKEEKGRARGRWLVVVV